ncbi:MAG: GNAT family N-acetyltransferase [Bacteroidales bacterium]|nr:GNAT family N-acetyltransferase [Bacteroidales bacterium]MCB9012728.1 GNAT family N-acetyltransferase [Bacteroidales bacterium]
MLKALEWDTGFFGVKTGKLDLNGLDILEAEKELGKLSKSAYRLVYVFAGHDDDGIRKVINAAGGQLRDEKVTFSMDISQISALSSGFIHSCMGMEMDNDLEQLSLESGKYSRFKTDPNIPYDKFVELYRLWMINSLNGSFAKEVFAYSDSGRKLGMVSVNIKQGEGWIGIIAVNEEFRGRSIGKYLMHAAIGFCRENGVRILNVQTQLENKVSCAFYERLGFRIREIEDVYHFWI